MPSTSLDPSENPSWYVYIVHCADGTYYTGISNNVVQRVALHNKGKGAKYTSKRLPVALVYTEAALDRSSASKREYAIKRLQRRDKERLIESESMS